MEKVIVFLDYANINAAARDAGCTADYGALLQYLADPTEGRSLAEAFAYVPIDPRREHAMDARIAELWDQGYMVRSKVGTIAGPSYKCDFDVEITLDIAKIAFDLHPDVVVLASGDSDFVPVVLEMRNRGIRVEVASFGHSASDLLKHRCSGYIDLGVLVDEDTDAAWEDDSDEAHQGYADEEDFGGYTEADSREWEDDDVYEVDPDGDAQAPAGPSNLPSAY